MNGVISGISSFQSAAAILISFVLSFIGASSTVYAADIKCTAKVALNQVYTVEIMEESGLTAIENASGSRFSGVANRYLSGRTGDITWFLGTGFAKGFEVSVENGGQNRTALCLAANECYLCR